MQSVRHWLNSWTRAELVSAAFFVFLINGTVTRVEAYTSAFGWEAGFFSLFGISAIVIVCAYLALLNCLSAGDSAPSRTDVAFYACLIALNLISTPIVSWVCLTIAALSEYLRKDQDVFLKRGAALMVGVSMTMFWGRVVFSLASSFILKIDAFLVATITSSAQVGNVVALENGAGYVWIADACSSFGNISLAMLCWLMFMEYRGRPERTVNDYVVCLFACVNVVVVNVTRISLIVRRPDLYETIHGPYGSAVAGYIATLLVVMVCSTGIKRAPKLAV